MAQIDNTTAQSRLDRLVPRIVLDWVTDEPDRRWRVVEGTMVFADISGFTALSEKLATRGRIGTEELVETLSRVFAGMLDITANRGGQLLKFGGDALLVLFTGPITPGRLRQLRWRCDRTCVGRVRSRPRSAS
jgi:class 3 adenylate cyclase